MVVSQHCSVRMPETIRWLISRSRSQGVEAGFGQRIVHMLMHGDIRLVGEERQALHVA